MGHQRSWYQSAHCSLERKLIQSTKCLFVSKLFFKNISIIDIQSKSLEIASRYTWMWHRIWYFQGKFVENKYIFCSTESHELQIYNSHDDIIKWKHFPRYWPFVLGIHWSPVYSPHKGYWHGVLMFTLMCAWINGWLSYLHNEIFYAGETSLYWICPLYWSPSHHSSATDHSSRVYIDHRWNCSLYYIKCVWSWRK